MSDFYYTKPVDKDIIKGHIMDHENFIRKWKADKKLYGEETDLYRVCAKCGQDFWLEPQDNIIISDEESENDDNDNDDENENEKIN